MFYLPKTDNSATSPLD